MKYLILVLIGVNVFFHSLHAFAEEKSDKKVAIVIDDFGNNMKGTEEILHLPVKLTIAVMPFLSTTKEDAVLAHKLGHEVILHLPMEPIKGKKSWLGPGAITTDLSNEEIAKRVNDAIDAVPYAVGINNHMGSKATADERVMKIILGICKERQLYYLDSKTSKKSVVSEIASELGVPFLENELFFDEVYTTNHIVKQTNQLIRKIDFDDSIIAIGHVGIAGEKTASVLKQYIPRLKQKAEPVTLSTLLVEKELITP
ncbi:divergent polysaccharide deacetylase family protein [Sutcliffiella halmapala]|uniref:divergent polysaccharide deacetylase family protein n=1 Tax=Sutcliffiella halmapala TaxID=79882 RepID=UPI000994F546|nr:divergent polysaccharide deacetylase family protein [Sutcliffiella halmapala]